MNAPELYLENQLCFPLYATSRLTTKIYAPYLEELGVTYPQYLVLLTLWQYNDQSVTSIGKRLYLESNTLTPLLKRLEQKRLIVRSRSKTDERTVMITLTDAGKKLKKKALEIPKKIIASFEDDTITEEEMIFFQKTLFKLLNVLNDKTS
ncbi:MarR family winged helix-turn-helix transcriptional regulator [Flagellimonas oceanensis]|uniref:MarR family winged helix-turn-helix transcriptional regulator n=1 Tax=Flagellimonas oceanensis TaxID=2499163 RepID=UPI000F8DF97B|nr:MarR family transcriptional regulator [Allomuricauda oceanensis]|tara:strand:- start:9209 stop:9658 length:450 start_codon:yes stop_codon:yes gene_type:complete